jgi:hypothetical protein
MSRLDNVHLSMGSTIKFKSLSTHYCMQTGGTRFE